MVPHLQPQRAELLLLHDARAAFDTASLSFQEFETNGAPSWVLATVTPSSRSGSATVPGAYIDGATGEFVNPSGQGAVVVKEGTWRPIASAHQADPDVDHEYSWTEPLKRRPDPQVPEDYYSPFSNGGTILCRPKSGSAEIDQFGPVRLLFWEWRDFVQPAFVLAQRAWHRNRQTVSHDNGLVATIALRELLRAKEISPQAASRLLDTADMRRRSVFIYVMLAMGAPDMAKESVRALVDRVQATQQFEEIQTIALGAFAAALFDSTKTDVAEGSRTVLIAARKRLQVDGRTGERATQLLLMCEKMGINTNR
jgi:hypothetical protein